jgi:hypothetical protein
VRIAHSRCRYQLQVLNGVNRFADSLLTMA